MSVKDESVSVVKTNYKDFKVRYALATRMVWAKLPAWKKQIVIECKVTGVNHRIFNEYAHEIAELADNETAVLSDTYPPVPHISCEQISLTK